MQAASKHYQSQLNVYDWEADSSLETVSIHYIRTSMIFVWKLLSKYFLSKRESWDALHIFWPPDELSYVDNKWALIYLLQTLKASSFHQVSHKPGAAVGIAEEVTGIDHYSCCWSSSVSLYTRKHCPQNPKPKSSTHQQQVDPEYDELHATSGEESTGLRENMAYGSLMRIELRENVAYEPVQHWYTQPQWTLFLYNTRHVFCMCIIIVFLFLQRSKWTS